MGYRFQIARRYLAGRRRFSLISVITGISTVGVALGVAALIVVLSVMNGFYDFVRGVLVSFDPHVVITRSATAGAGGSARGLVRADSLARVARQVRYVKEAAPYVEGRALVAPRSGNGSTGGNRVVQVRGISPALAKHIGETKGADGFDLGRENGLPGIVVGMGMAERLGLLPSTDLPSGSTREGSAISLLSAPSIERAFTQIFGGPPLMRFEVRGLYEQESVYDQGRAFIAYEEAQRLFHMEGRATGVALRVTDLDRADEVQAALQEQLGTTASSSPYRVQTWYDLQGSLYDVMRLEKWGASAILLLIVVVAAFNIVGSMMMTVIEKQRDIGVLKAMGASRRDVHRIFLNEGMLIGGVGTGAGLLLGLTLALLQQAFSLVPMAQAESFLIDAYPIAIRPLDVLVIALVSLALCVLASVYPARRAASVEPARAVQQGE